jgi:hypothetical protein
MRLYARRFVTTSSTLFFCFFAVCVVAPPLLSLCETPPTPAAPSLLSSLERTHPTHPSRHTLTCESRVVYTSACFIQRRLPRPLSLIVSFSSTPGSSPPPPPLRTHTRTHTYTNNDLSAHFFALLRCFLVFSLFFFVQLIFPHTANKSLIPYENESRPSSRVLLW